MRNLRVLALALIALLAVSCSDSGSTTTTQTLTNVVSKDPEEQKLIKAAQQSGTANAYAKLAKYYASKRMVNPALTNYRKALDIDSMRWDIRIELGEFAYNTDNKKVALLEFKLVLESSAAAKYADVMASYLFGYKITRLTTGPSHSAFPSWSHDGNRIYFQTSVNGNWDIASIDTTGGDLKFHQNSPNNETHPTISQDGRYMVYESDRMDDRFVANSQKNREIYAFDTKTNQTERLTRNFLDDFYPRFDRTDNQLTYITEEVNENKTKYGERFTYLFIMNSDGSFQIPVMEPGNFRVNSGVKVLNGDKEEVYFYSAKKEANYDIYKYNATKRLDDVFFKDNSNKTNVDVYKDGSKVIFTSDKFGSADLFMSNEFATRIERLTRYQNDASHGVFNPSGTKIAFMSNEGGQWDIYLINLKSRDVEPTVPNLLTKVNSELYSL